VSVNNGSKRVILITGDRNKWYDQAIFIVKRNIPEAKMPADFVCEAENIIENYLSGARGGSVTEYACGEPYPNPSAWTVVGETAKKKKKGMAGVDLALNVVMLVCCVVLAILIAMAVTG
jgi:hypothetical protein